MVERLRDAVARLLTPLARLLIGWGIHPDVITWLGTAAVVAAASIMIPLGLLWQAALVLGVLSFADMLDGQIARLSGKSSRWGAFLDSTLDRVGDGAVFGAVAVWCALEGHALATAVVVVCLVLGQVTSYVKARAEAQQWKVEGGLAARGDRLVMIYLGLLLQGLGVPWALVVAASLLAIASTITVIQRFRQVWRQAAGAD